MGEEKNFIIIDSNSIIHRAYYALPALTTKKGELVNAVYGFLLVLFKVIREFQPDYIVATFDTPQPTFRHQKYKEYKAKRPPTPENLTQQIPKVKEVLRALAIPIFEKVGFEADDIIASLKIKNLPRSVPHQKFGGGPLRGQKSPHQNKFGAGQAKIKNIIISGDLDLLQLVDDQTKVYILKKGIKETILYDKNKVLEKYQGLSPGQLVDFKALRGDPSDNIPGVPSIGEKTALDLISKFGSLENLYEEIQSPKSKIQISNKLKIKLLEYKEQAFFSKSLVQIKKDLVLNFNLKKCLWKSPSHYPKKMEKVTQILKNLEFYSLINRLPLLKIKTTNNQEQLF